MRKFAVKKPLTTRISGARANRIRLGKRADLLERASTGLAWELELTTRRPPGSLPSRQVKNCPHRPRGRPCTHGDGLLETRPCRWPGSYNGQSPRTSLQTLQVLGSIPSSIGSHFPPRFLMLIAWSIAKRSAETQGGGGECPGALFARRTRTIGMCSSDARSKEQPWPLPLRAV